MRLRFSGLTFLLVTVVARMPPSQPLPQVNTGTIKGRVHLTGKLPGNPVSRMGADPKCSQMNAGKRVIEEIVVADVAGTSLMCLCGWKVHFH
jgi:hypothetical protein